MLEIPFQIPSSFNSVQNYTTLKHKGLDTLVLMSFNSVQNYTTLKPEQ